MSKQIATTHKFGDKGYAGVPGRLLEFREDNPRADVATESTINVDGSITFRATIIKDLADEHSARATGTARYTAEELKKQKAFEKLETVCVGRALALLGYLNDGQIATTEEMEEFEQHRKQLKDAEKNSAMERLADAKDLASLKDTFFSLGDLMRDEDVVAAKNIRKVELDEAN